MREVEEALVQLASTTEREAHIATSARSHRANLAAAQAKFQTGLGSALELEEARRLSLAADATQLALTHERLAAWIALYRAAGGGWDADTMSSANSVTSAVTSAVTSTVTSAGTSR